MSDREALSEPVEDAQAFAAMLHGFLMKERKRVGRGDAVTIPDRAMRYAWTAAREYERKAQP